MTCLHSYIEEGFCNECGQAMNISGSYLESSSYLGNHATKSIKNTFESDLQAVLLPIDIKEEIINLSLSITNITRKNVRKRVLFSLAYTAYLKLNKSFDPEQLALVFNLTSNDYTAAIKLVAGIGSNVNSGAAIIPIAIINPVTYFENLLIDLKTFSGVIINEEDLKYIFSEIEKIEPTKIFSYQPKHVAVAIIKFYLDSKNISINKFHTCFNMTTATIKKHVEIIRQILEREIVV